MNRSRLACIMLALTTGCGAAGGASTASPPGSVTRASDAPVPSEKQADRGDLSGDGWRLLLTVQRMWPAAPSGVGMPGAQLDRYWIEVAETPDAAARLWALLDVAPGPAVDTSQEVVVAVGLPAQECAHARVTGVSLDPATGIVAVHADIVGNFATFPPPSGAYPMCPVASVPTLIVLALDRSRLPPGALRVRVDLG